MRVRRLETVVQFVADVEASKDWYAGVLDVEPTPCAVPYFKFAEHAYLILSPSAPGTYGVVALGCSLAGRSPGG